MRRIAILVLAAAAAQPVAAQDAKCPMEGKPLVVKQVRGDEFSELLGEKAYNIGGGKLCVQGMVYSRGKVIAAPENPEVLGRSCAEVAARANSGASASNRGASDC